ncbi:hypothetical protein Tco_0491476 [Tanacetum coccineum]
MGEPGRSKTVLLYFAIVKCRSPYNVIMRITKMRSLGAVGSTIYSMIKFPTTRGVTTIETSKEAMWECRQVKEMQSSWKETQWRQHMKQMSRIREKAILRSRSIPNQRPGKEPMMPKETWEEDMVKEKVTIHNDHPDQPIVINGKQSSRYKQKLEETLRKNIDVFAWTTTRKMLKEKVIEWLREGISKRIQHPGWVANAVPIKQRDGTWQMQMDYTSLNKVYAKDMYPFPEIEEELGLLMGQNIEVYLEEIVVKSKSGQNLIKDVEETLDKLQRVNVKIDPSKCTFGMEEGKFLGYEMATEGIRVDLEKVKVILRIPTPRGPDQIQSLSLQLTNISKFIPKLAEPMLPIRNIRRSLDATKGEQVLRVSDKNNEGASGSKEKPQEELVLAPRTWRLYVEREPSKEGSGVRMILVKLEEKVYSYAIRLNFYASEDSMDYEALLAELVASASRGMKDLHEFVGSKLLAD